MTYASFTALAADLGQVLGADYRIRAFDRRAPLALVAIHGGGIETGTSELVRAIAGEDSDDGVWYGEYRFEGLKSSGNSVLHITSTGFDEPQALRLLRNSLCAVTLHGFSDPAQLVHVGGLDTVLRDRVAAALESAGFTLGTPPAGLDGTEPDNVTNRGLSGAGVQLELSTGLRSSFFTVNTGAGRWGSRTAAFNDFVGGVRSALAVAEVALG